MSVDICVGVSPDEWQSLCDNDNRGFTNVLHMKRKKNVWTYVPPARQDRVNDEWAFYDEIVPEGSSFVKDAMRDAAKDMGSRMHAHIEGTLFSSLIGKTFSTNVKGRSK